MSVDVLFQEFTKLSASEQKNFLDEVLSYLYSEGMQELPPEVIEENLRRLQAYDAGETEGIPYQEALAYVRAQLNAA